MRTSLSCFLVLVFFLQGCGILDSSKGDSYQIAFQSDRNGDYDIFLMDTDGGSLTNLTEGFSNSRYVNPRFSPDGRKIIFSSDLDVDLYLMDLDSMNKRLLVRDVLRANFSSDGTQLVFNTRDGINIINSDGTNLTNQPRVKYNASFSPDNSQIVFTAVDDVTNIQDIYIINVDGTNRRNLTDNPAGDNHAVFLPDGTKIIFSSNRNNNHADIYLMDTDGSNLQNLTNTASQNESRHSFSNNGKKMRML